MMLMMIIMSNRHTDDDDDDDYNDDSDYYVGQINLWQILCLVAMMRIMMMINRLKYD